MFSLSLLSVNSWSFEVEITFLENDLDFQSIQVMLCRDIKNYLLSCGFSGDSCSIFSCIRRDLDHDFYLICFQLSAVSDLQVVYRLLSDRFPISNPFNLSFLPY